MNFTKKLKNIFIKLLLLGKECGRNEKQRENSRTIKWMKRLCGNYLTDVYPVYQGGKWVGAAMPHNDGSKRADKTVGPLESDLL